VIDNIQENVETTALATTNPYGIQFLCCHKLHVTELFHAASSHLRCAYNGFE